MISDGRGNFWDLDDWGKGIRKRPPREKLREPDRIYKSNQTYAEDLADLKEVNKNDTIINELWKSRGWTEERLTHYLRGEEEWR